MPFSPILLIPITLIAIFLICVYIKHKCFLKGMIFTAVSGVLTLLIITLIGYFTGHTILNFNAFNLCVSSFLGVPGVLLVLILNLIWFL